MATALLKSDRQRAIIRTAARANQRHDLTQRAIPAAANATPIGWTDEYFQPCDNAPGHLSETNRLGSQTERRPSLESSLPAGAELFFLLHVEDTIQ